MMRIALALVCLAAQVGAGIHAVAVRHERCAEHGEVVHGEHGHDAQHGAGALALQVAHLGEGQGAAPADEDHDHCAMPLLRRQAEPGFCIPAVIAPSAPPAVPAPLATPVAVTRPLYRLAPKASPPAAA